MLTKLPVLISYAYLRDEPPARIEQCFARDDVELLLDCGAFTVANTDKPEIKLEDYIAFVKRWEGRLFSYMSLDRLGDTETTDRNLRTMLDAGLKPIPVHVLGDGQERMDELFALSDWVAFGGLRRPKRGPAPLSYVKAKMKWARGCKVHWLGYTRAQSLVTWKPYSCDCSNFTAGSQWGLFEVYLGRGRWRRIESSTKKARNQSSLSAATLPVAGGEVLKRLARWGFDTDKVVDERNWKGSTSGGNVVLKAVIGRFMASIPAFSYVEYSLDVRERFGSRIFLAASPEQSLGLYAALDYIRTLR